MGWSIGEDNKRDRDIGYGVPATCDHPGCGKEIDRGLGYVCGAHPWGGDHGCGLFFCGAHLGFSDDHGDPVCERCQSGEDPFDPTPDTPEWLRWKLTDESWAEWRSENPSKVEAMTRALAEPAA